MPARSASADTTPPQGLALWWAGARPRTLPLSVAPVAVGVAAASAYVPDVPWWEGISWWRAALALLVSVMLQIGVNFANDYSDGVRGTDADRVGPLRLTASGLVSPAKVKRAAFGCFGVAAVAGLVLAASTAWWLLLVGVAAILAAWFYTGGKHPYGYAGLGDVSVFVFFGLVAVMGTSYVAGVHPQLTTISLGAAVPCGLLAVAVLVTNNLRDLPKDAVAGKRTSAVRLGDRATRWMYVLCVVPSFVIGAFVVGWPWGLIVLAAAAFAIVPVRIVLGGAQGMALIPVLARTSRMQLLFASVVVIGLLVTAQW